MLTHLLRLQMMRLVLILFGFTLWSCAWGATTMPYPIKEAASAGNRDIAWLDNTRVVFHGATGGEGSPGHESPVTNRGTYVWDVERGTATREPRFDRADPPICSRGPYLSYIEHAEDLKSAKRRAFESGQEIILPEPGKFWSNPISCRTYTTKPWWVVEGRATVRLLEEHGYLDRGVKDQDRTTDFPLLYYRTGAAQPLPIELGSMQVDPTVRYAPFLDAYLLEGQRGALWAPPLWLLHPNGVVEQIFNPEGKAWAKQSWSWVVLTKRGPVFGKITYRGDQGRDSGAYLWENGTLTQLENAVLTLHSVSPDGCKLAVIQFRPERSIPPAELHRLQIIDLCNGGKNVH